MQGRVPPVGAAAREGLVYNTIQLVNFTCKFYAHCYYFGVVALQP